MKHCYDVYEANYDECQDCMSTRFMNVSATNHTYIQVIIDNNIEHYINPNLNVGDWYDINFNVCADCGNVCGTWPVSKTFMMDNIADNIHIKSNKNCSKCDTNRWLLICGSNNLSSTIVLDNVELRDYIPTNINIGTNEIEIKICANCGCMDGTWPLEKKCHTKEYHRNNDNTLKDDIKFEWHLSF